MIPGTNFFESRRRLIEGPGEVNSGAWQISCFRIVKGWGQLPSDHLPHENKTDGRAIQEEPPNADEIAKHYRLIHYQRLRSELQCLYSVVNGRLTIAVLETTKAWANPPSGHIPLDGGGYPVKGVHSIAIREFDFELETFVFPNTWGENWGYKGLGFLPFSYLSRYLVEGWTAPVDRYAPPPTKPGIDLRILQGEESKLGTPWILDIVDGDNDVLVGWAHILQARTSFDVEEFFVRPDYRRRGHGTALFNEIKRAAPKDTLLRFWVPWGDHCEHNSASLLGWSKKVGLELKPSGVRWAAFLAIDGAPTDSLPELDWIPAKASSPLHLLIEDDETTTTNWEDIANEDVSQWTEEKATRRAELVEKKYAENLTPDELREFEALQEEFGRYQDKIAPLPPE